MDEIVVQNTSANPKPLERKIRPQKEHDLNCPRCNSTNTKFCYYNNYSLTQPRYFCKGCRRYWTEGGTLRNIPFGGGSRKNKRQSSSSLISPSSTNSSKKIQQNPKIIEGQDLNLGFPSSDFKTISQLIQVPNFENADKGNLLGGMSSSSRGLSSFMPMPFCDPNVVFPNGFSLQNEFKPTLNFSLDGFGGNGEFENLQGAQDHSGNGRLLFPFEDLKQISGNNTSGLGHDREHGDSTGYWNGVLGNGSW